MEAKKAKSGDIGPAYCFYKYNRTKTGAAENATNHSLTALSTSLPVEDETDLRVFLSKRLSRGALLESEGNISAFYFGDVDPSNDLETEPVICYFCLLSRDRDEMTQLLAEVTAASASNQPKDEFIVCLLAGQKHMLDLFRTELDQFSLSLGQQLNADFLLELDLQLELGQSDQVEKSLRPLLQNWHKEATQYLVNSVNQLGQNIQHLIFCALTDTHVTVSYSDQQLVQDLLKFIECCSMQELLTTVREVPGQASDTSSDGSLVHINDNGGVSPIPQGYTSGGLGSRTPVQLKLDPAKDKGDAHLYAEFSGHPDPLTTLCTPFCMDWAMLLVNGTSDDPVYIKKVIETHKIKLIQDMNSIKRLVKQAESDFYALFRCHVFLDESRNRSILLQNAEVEATGTSNHTALEVLRLLQTVK